MALASSPRRIVVTFRGSAAVAAVLALVALPYLLARSLAPAEAEPLVRQHLLLEATKTLRGQAIPDAATAARFERNLKDVERVRFRSVEVRRALIVPPLRRRTNFAVKVVIAGSGARADRTRYFWLFGTGAGSVADSSRAEWNVPL